MPTVIQLSNNSVTTTQLFTDDLFAIHPPQRRYKWTRVEVRQLFNDLKNAHAHDHDDNHGYFLGTLLLVPRDGRLSILDGQQRIATMSILIAVLRDYCDMHGDLHTRRDNLQRLISRVDNDGNPMGMVVTLQHPDSETHKDLVQQLGATRADLVKGNHLVDAAILLRQLVGEHLAGQGAVERLREFSEFVQAKVKFLPVEVATESEGYLVFDTTNTRGLKLAPADALKGRLATIAREDRHLSEHFIVAWNTVATKLEEADLPMNAMDDYVRIIWVATGGHVQKTRLDKIAEDIEKSQLSGFVQDLNTYIESYLAVTAPKGTSRRAQDLRDLNHLNRQSHGFLTMVHKHAPSRIDEAINAVLSLQIRNITMGTYQANAYEQDWPKWSHLAYSGRVDDVINAIRAELVSDDRFRDAFEQSSASAPITTRHLLRRLDPVSKPTSGVVVSDVDIEHIIPDSVSRQLLQGNNLAKNVQQWIQDLGYEVPKTVEEKKALGRIIAAQSNRLGNKALLSESLNRSVKNRPFGKKQDSYKNQKLELTQELAENETWDFDSIEARQKRLAELAVTIW